MVTALTGAGSGWGACASRGMTVTSGWGLGLDLTGERLRARADVPPARGAACPILGVAPALSPRVRGERSWQ